MPRLTEQDKILMLSKLEEEWSIRRVATHNALNKSTVLQVNKRWEQEGTVSTKKTDHNFFSCCQCHL
jgi:DNA-binding transcriptional regulator YhcF (GntR family)